MKSLTIYKLARPINASDIDTMKIEEWQKAKLKTHLDTSLKPQLIASELRFEADSIFKSKTSYMGIFISKDSILQNVFTDKWYVFKPEFERPSFWKISLPKGYVLANKDYYMDASDARLEEAPQFKK